LTDISFDWLLPRIAQAQIFIPDSLCSAHHIMYRRAYKENKGEIKLDVCVNYRRYVMVEVFLNRTRMSLQTVFL